MFHFILRKPHESWADTKRKTSGVKVLETLAQLEPTPTAELRTTYN